MRVQMHIQKDGPSARNNLIEAATHVITDWAPLELLLGRKVGDSSSGIEFEDLALGQCVIGPYRQINCDGRNLRSMTAVLRHGESKSMGMMCINFDVLMVERLALHLSMFAFVPEWINPLA